MRRLDCGQPREDGSALLRHALERCDRDGSASYLDATSPVNKRLYERHGFKELGVVHAGSSPPPPPMWPMQRKPG
jgi:GNAT superfamily N-acetyltransferase